MKKFGLILAGLLLSAPVDASAQTHLPTIYPCTDPLLDGLTCSFDPGGVVKLGGKVKVQTRQIYDSALPPDKSIKSVEIIVDCAKASYRISTGTSVVCKSCMPAAILPSPIDREILGSSYEGLFGAVCGKNK